MNLATAAVINKAIDAFIAITGFLSNLGVNYREVMEAQEKAKAEGRDDLNVDERQVFIDQAQTSVDRL